MSPIRRRSALLLAGAVTATACSSGASGSDVATLPTDLEATPTAAATWSLVDDVPSHRKPGVLVRIGLDAHSELDAAGAETVTRLAVEDPSAMFAISPARGAAVPFDAIEMTATSDDSVDLWPFVLGADGRMVRFVSDDGEIDACNELGPSESTDVLGFEARFGERFPIAEVECRIADRSDLTLLGVVDGADPVALFGVWVQADAETEGLDADVVIEQLALLDTSEPLEPSAPLLIAVDGSESTVAARSPDADDDAGIEVLTALDSNGTVTTVPITGTTAELPVDGLVGPVRISIDDVGLLHHPLQGAWIDLSVSTRSLVIDATPEFTPTDSSPAESDRRNGAHVLAEWLGSSAMERQEYEGLTFRNNEGDADRDRISDSDCRRAAYLGGSFVEAVQTRVDQKPGILAEAILETRSDGCVEVFTLGSDRFAVENHLGNARTLVEDFGVDILVLSVSGQELCRLDDIVFANTYGVDPTTPTHWRYVDGEIIEPFRRGDAIEFEATDDFEIEDRCDFAADGAAGEVADSVMEKLAELEGVIEGFGPDVVVRFTNVKDAVLGLDDDATGVEQRCARFGVDCLLLEIPHPLVAPVSVTDATDFLYRYQFDPHPNVRANQLIAAHLADIVADALR